MEMNTGSPGWLADLFASIMLIVAMVSAGRLYFALRWSRPVHLEVELDHLLMGVAMAGMFVAPLNPFPSVLWEVVFSIVAAWLVLRCVAALTGRATRVLDRHGHHMAHYPTHLVMALAMLYMFFASGPSGAMAAATGSTADFVGLPLLFLVVLIASGIWEIDRAGRLWRSKSASVSPAVSEYTLISPDAGAQASAPLARASVAVMGQTGTAPEDLLAPGVMAAAHVAMCIAMGYMLITLL